MTTICIDCRYIGPRPSGIAEVVQGLIDQAPALAPDLDFLLLKSPHAPDRLSTARNVRERVVAAPANGPATMWWLPRIVDLSGVDLFHATFNIMPAGLEMPCVTTIHDVMWLTDPALCQAGRGAGIRRAFFGHGMRRALRRSAAIATVSQASRDAIGSIDGAAAARTRVTLSGVSPEFRPVPPDPAVLAALGIRTDRTFVLTIGQYAPYKNHEGALRAFAAAFSDDHAVDLVLVQRMGSSAGRMRHLAATLGISDRVHFVHAIGRDVLMQLYSGASALLHPSFCEGFGNPLAEAMACGCPVITSNVSAMPEVTGGAAITIDPNDIPAIAAALRTVTSDTALANTMRERGLARAAQLSWSAFAAANVAIYREVLAPASCKAIS